MSFIDETLSSFPNSLDQFNFLYTLPASQKTNASRYMILLQKTRTPEEEAEFVSLTITLNDYLLTVDRWNKFASCIYSLEKFFSQNVQGYLTTKQTEWEAILNKFSDKGTYNPTITYMKWNTCQYNGETFLSKIDNNLNHTPVEGDVDIYWQKIAQKGVPGEQGIQGLPGANLIPRGKFLLTDIYNTDDLAEDNGSQYRCLQDGVTGIPTSNKTYWDLFLAKGGSTIIGGLPYTVTLSEPTSNVEFVGVGKISAFNKNLDISMVFVDGHYLRKDVEYSINANGISIDKIPTATSSEVTWSAGTIINFLIIKNIVETINFNDGQLIDDESITINKLSEGLQDSINNIENKDGSFKIKSAFYTVGTDTLSIVISDGVGETISSNTINTITKTTDTTFNITPVTASATYTIYLKNDGNFASSLDSPILNGSILIGTISINADKSVNTIVDKRPLISASGNKLINLSSSFDEHTNGINPHNVTKLQIGLENVDNVQQASKVEFNEHKAETAYYEKYTKSANQSIANITETEITFNSRSYTGLTDQSLAEINASNRINIKKAGVYSITVKLEYGANSTGIRALMINSIVFQQLFAGADYSIIMANTQPLEITANNTVISLPGYQTSGGALDLLASTCVYIRKL